MEFLSFRNIIWSIGKRNSRVYHRPLDVYTGRLEDWQELKSGDGWYRELGKMDVLEALLGLEDYESGVRGCAGGTDGCKRFMTPRVNYMKKKIRMHMYSVI